MSRVSRPRILLLIPASSYRAADFLHAARQLGLLVTVGSDHRQVLAGLAPANSLYVDFDQLQQSVRTICAFADSYTLSAIVGTDDCSLELAAEASRRLGLSGNAAQAVRAARDKLSFRQLGAVAGIPSPLHANVASEAAAVQEARRVGYPCVLKPRSLAASQGVIRVDDEHECRLAAKRIFRLLEDNYTPQHPHRTSLLLEKFLPGREYAIDGLLVDGVFQTLAIFDKPEAMNGPFFEETLFITPSRARPSLITAMLGTITAAAAALGLNSGPVHAEFRADDTLAHAEPVLLELAPRSIGGHCSRALRFATDASLESIILEAALGRESDHKPARGASGVMMIPIPASGVLRAVEGLERARSVPRISALTLTIGVGENVQTLPEGNRYLGFIFADGDHPGDIETALRTAHAQLAFDIECAGGQQH